MQLRIFSRKCAVCKNEANKRTLLGNYSLCEECYIEYEKLFQKYFATLHHIEDNFKRNLLNNIRKSKS